MPFQPPVLANVNAALNNITVQKTATEAFILLFNPMTGEYLGTEQQAYDWKVSTLQRMAQVTFCAGIDIACFPLGQFVSACMDIP